MSQSSRNGEENIIKLFTDFEHACAHYWQNDQLDRISDRRLKELYDDMQVKRSRFLLALSPLSPQSETGPSVEWLEEELVSILRTIAPRKNEDAADCALMIHCARRIFEADQERYEAMVDRVGKRLGER